MYHRTMYMRCVQNILQHSWIRKRIPVPLVRRIFTDTNDERRTVTRRFGLDYEYLCNPENSSVIEELIKKRKGVGDIRKVVELSKKLQSQNMTTEEYTALETELEKAALMIPNKASPHLFEYGETPKVIEYVNSKPDFSFKPREVHELGKDLDIIRMENLGNLTGPRSYYLRGALADLEQALIRYTVSSLLKRGFVLMSVPDLLYSHIIEGCGMSTRGQRTQVYHIADSEDVCLSGTAEMAIGGYLKNREFSLKELPLKLAAVSRCYRAETSSLREEKGIYRVHGFTKVEMFGVTAAESKEESHQLYSEMTEIQKELFSSLAIHFQILDMPLHELGAPAYTKTDMEAWMPGRGAYGEISSASNCTDYQSCRLNISYRNKDGVQKLAHTVNGTACAIPRSLIAICETHQTEEGHIRIPPVLRPYMSGLETIIPSASQCQMSWIKQKTYPGKIR